MSSAGDSAAPRLRARSMVAPFVVALAVATMVALGFWQWERRAEKAVLIARFEANRTVTEIIDLPDDRIDATAMLFRRARVSCAQQGDWRPVAGRDASGQAGYRFITSCRSSDGAPPTLVDMGVARDPATRPGIVANSVTGIIVPGPDQPSLIDRLSGMARQAPIMVQADRAANGLQPSQPPSPQDVPNNHLAYAVQWWLFAVAAVVIYVLAARRR